MSIAHIIYMCDECRVHFLGKPWVSQTATLEHFCTIECRNRAERPKPAPRAVEQASDK